ncbi:hypothetical protein [Actinoplanes rectilineatus]|uniref:hypothetical protein n=1 Tax=Actinoplanes rectilineatus TaxID=113571 RepID=UPI000ACC7BD8|nr:hypothetical protein [Actinoplanes rectilineatus]
MADTLASPRRRGDTSAAPPLSAAARQVDEEHPTTMVDGLGRRPSFVKPAYATRSADPP